MLYQTYIYHKKGKKTDTLQRNTQGLLSGPTFLQYAAAVPMLCYYFKNKRRRELLKTICITGFFEENLDLTRVRFNFSKMICENSHPQSLEDEEHFSLKIT